MDNIDLRDELLEFIKANFKDYKGQIRATDLLIDNYTIRQFMNIKRQIAVATAPVKNLNFGNKENSELSYHIYVLEPRTNQDIATDVVSRILWQLAIKLQDFASDNLEVNGSPNIVDSRYLLDAEEASNLGLFCGMLLIKITVTSDFYKYKKDNEENEL